MEIKIEKKLTYLQETKDAIKSALIEKGQTVSDTDTFRSYAEKILAIEGGGSTETDIIPEQEFALALNSQLGVYMASGFDLFSLKSGEKYYVVWGEETFTCTAVDGVFEGAPCVAIGNPYPVGGTNNNLPFVIGCVPNFEGHTLCVIVALAEQTETKKVRVYQKASGGSGDAVVWFVTFIGADGTELYRMPVLDGDDCKDPYTRGDIEKPTKESTVSQVFTYNGWALTDGGEADANALKAVTEDRTVYAAFDFEVRTYTITFYDGDTILTSQTLPYGATPSYTPEKSGFSFDGWNPAISTVTGDASYQAKWIEAVTFANGTWEDIMDVVNSGDAATTFKVGDTRSITLTDGTTKKLYILGFDHDDLANGSGKAKMTIGCEVLSDKISIQTFGKPVSVWEEVSTTMKNTFKPKLPTEIRNSIKSVLKPCDGLTVSDISSVSFELFPVSQNEMDITKHRTQTGWLYYGDETWNSRYASLGTPYAYFTQIKDSSYGGPKATGLGSNYKTNKPFIRQREFTYFPQNGGDIAYFEPVFIKSSGYYYLGADGTAASKSRVITLAFCV